MAGMAGDLPERGRLRTSRSGDGDGVAGGGGGPLPVAPPLDARAVALIRCYGQPNERGWRRPPICVVWWVRSHGVNVTTADVVAVLQAPAVPPLV
jgi:hypothetical protein